MSASTGAAIVISTALSVIVLGLAISTMTILPSPVRASDLVSPRGSTPSVGDYIPRSMRIIGVDGESPPHRYGILIYDGNVVALVDATSRKIIQVVSDKPF